MGGVLGGCPHRQSASSSVNTPDIRSSYQDSASTCETASMQTLISSAQVDDEDVKANSTNDGPILVEGSNSYEDTTPLSDVRNECRQRQVAESEETAEASTSEKKKNSHSKRSSDSRFTVMPDDPGSVRVGELACPLKGIKARDAQGNSHRGQEWTGSRCFIGEDSPICVVRQGQKDWLASHSDLNLKWSYPTKQRDCLKVSFRAAEKTESLLSGEFRSAFGELVHSYPPIVVRIMCHLYLNYWHPHHKRIQAQGRHLIMLKVYEGKNEAHCWHVPLKEVVELHRTSADSMSGGMSLNDVQLVQTYVVENTLALHVETFERDMIRRSSTYGTRTWVGGMAIHMITDETEGPAVERSQEFAMMPTEQRGDFTEKRGKIRERRERKKAEQKLKKEEEAAAIAEKIKLEKEAEEASKNSQRKEALKKPHESLTQMLKKGTMPFEDDTMFSEEAPLTEEELALFSVPTHRAALLQPHPSLSKLLSDKAARAAGVG